MTAPTLIEVTNHLREHYSLTMAELLKIMRTPMNPAGMRDEFAVAALPAIIGHAEFETCLQCAEIAYAYADAMLEARNANR